jgi:hypothetical protein
MSGIRSICAATLAGIALNAFVVTKSSVAAVLTWQITGEVTSVSVNFGSEFSVGDRLDFVFTFNTQAADSNPDPNVGGYYDAMSSGRVTVGSYTAVMERHPLFVHKSRGGLDTDSFGFSGLLTGSASAADIRGTDGPLYSFAGVFGHYEDTTGSMLTSDALPDSASLLENRSNDKIIHVSWQRSEGATSYSGGITAGIVQLHDITPVPEPSTYLLMLAGLGFVGYAARRRRRA